MVRQGRSVSLFQSVPSQRFQQILGPTSAAAAISAHTQCENRGTLKLHLPRGTILTSRLSSVCRRSRGRSSGPTQHPSGARTRGPRRGTAAGRVENSKTLVLNCTLIYSVSASKQAEETKRETIYPSRLPDCNYDLHAGALSIAVQEDSYQV